MLSTKLSTFATGACLTAVSMAFSHAAAAAWVSGAPMLTERSQHAGALLDDGSYAVFGGVNHNGFVATAERLAGNVWNSIGAMAITGNEMESVTLGTGQVLVRADGSLQARLYDPESNSWSDAGVQSVTRSMPSMTLLADGQLLLAGGSNEKSAELYDPQTRTWTPTASMSVARRAHAAVLMHDGRVLVASGFNNSSGEVPSAEIYDPVAGTWSPAAPPLVPRHYASMNLLPDGRLLLAGGFTAAGVTNHAELYDPVANTWTATGALNHPRDSMMGYLSAHSTVLPSRKVLLAGGSDGARNPQPVAEVYDPATGTWSIADAINPARENGTASLLPSGEVLITGGHSSNPSTAFYANTDRYQPPVPANNLAVLDSLPLLQRRGVLTLTGTGFKGAGGTDIPSLELQRVENGFIYRIGSTSHSATQFVSTPLPNLPAGLYMARLIVAGEPSAVAQLVRFTDPAGTPSGTAGALQVAVSWTAPADDRGNPPVGYEVNSSPASAGCTAVAPSTQCTVNGLTAGTNYTFTVRAKHANGLGPESAPSLSVTPLPAPSPQTIDFVPPAPHKFGTTYQPQATATSGLNVGFVVDSGPCVAQQPSGPITFTGVGDCTIRATQPGNTTYQAAPDVAHVLVVEQGIQTLRFTPPPPSTAQVGRYTPVVEGGASGNPVIVTASGVARQQRLLQKAVADVCTLDAGTVTFGAEGTCTITATQDGNANYAPAQAQSYDITVTAAAVVTQPTPVPSLSQLTLMLLSAAMAGLAAISFRRKRLN